MMQLKKNIGISFLMMKLRWVSKFCIIKLNGNVKIQVLVFLKRSSGDTVITRPFLFLFIIV